MIRLNLNGVYGERRRDVCVMCERKEEKRRKKENKH